MQPVTAELLAILQSKFQAGASGHRALIEYGTPTIGGATTGWEEFTRVEAGPALGPTTGGQHYEWENVLSDVTGDEPLLTVDGSQFHYQDFGPSSALYMARIYAADEWWADGDWGVTMTFTLAAQADTEFNHTIGMQFGDTPIDAAGDGDYAFARLDPRNQIITVGNRLADHDSATLSFDPRGAGPCFLRWEHTGTYSRAKIWKDGDPEPTFGTPGDPDEPDTVTREDVGDDSISEDMFAFFINLFGTGPDAATASLDVRIDSIDPGVTYDGETGFTWATLGILISASVDKSYGADADAMTLTLKNPAQALSPYVTEVVLPNLPIRLWQWYGDDLADDLTPANKVLTFTGLIDSIVEHRQPDVVTIRAKDRMKLLLVESVVWVTDPQGADEDGAVRTPANGVYLNAQVLDIVNDLLDRAGWPAAKRDITDINYIVDEFTVALGDSVAGAIRRAANLVVYEPWVDENEVFQMHPRPSVLSGESTDAPVTAVASFSGANEVMVIDAGLDDDELRTRVYVFGPAATDAQDTWTEIWHSNAIRSPNGLWSNPDDTPTVVWVIDGRTRKVYTINQTTLAATVQSPALSSNSLAGGMDGDDPDSTDYLWVLETPFRNAADGLSASSDPCKIRKVRISDWTTVASHDLGAGVYTAIRGTSSYLWLARYDTQKIKKLQKSDFSTVATYDVSAFGSPTGLAVDESGGPDLWIFAGGEIHVVDVSAPTVEIDTHPIPGNVGGGEIDSVDSSYMYADFPALGLVYKYQFVIPGTPAITGQAIDYDLEDEIGERSGVEPRTHVDCPNDSDPHPYQIRLEVVTDDKLTSNTAAGETAQRLLNRLSQRHRTIQVGVVANPAIQKGDPVEVHDPPTGLDHQLVMVESYRTDQQGGSYVGVISGPIWTTEY